MQLKRIICILLLLPITTGLFSQKWLKNIGKVLNKAEKVVGQFTDGKNLLSGQGYSTPAPATFVYGDVKVCTSLPHFTIVVEDVKRLSYTNGAVYLTLTNTSDSPIRIYDWQNITQLADSKGNSYADYGKWELQIGNCTIRRYGTDGDYVFPTNQKVNAIFYIVNLEGTLTTKSETLGSLTKTTISAPAVTIDHLQLNPSIVYQEENVRRNYTIEISNLKIPAYVHIDRARLEKDFPVQAGENSVRDSIKTVENDSPKNKSTEGEKKDPSEPPIIAKEPSLTSTDNDDKKNEGDNGSEPQKMPGQNYPESLEKSAINIDPSNELGSIDTFKGPTLTEKQWETIIQDMLNRQAKHVALRRDVHYTNEPADDWSAQYRFTSLNLSSAEYDNFDGILFERVDADLQFKTHKEREIATQYSSYPRKGTQCGIITSIANDFRKDMKEENHMGVPAYIFNANKLTLNKIEETDKQTVNGKKMMVFIISVTDAQTPFGIAYSEAIRKANHGEKKNYEPEQLLRGLGFEYNSQTQQWKLVMATKYNAETGKWEKWVTL